MNTDTTPAPPGRPGLSFEAYEKAYRELSHPDGTPPSQRQLRRYLGTGSNTTLAGYRRRLAEARHAEELPPESGTIDAQLITLVQQLAKQIALDEAQLAQDRVDEIQADAEQRIRIAVTTMEKRLLDTALLEHRATTAEKTVEEQRSALSEKEEKLSQLDAQCLTLKTSETTLTQSLDETRRQLATVSRQYETLQEKHEQSQAAQKAESERHRADHQDVQQSLSESRTKLASVTEKHAGLTALLKERNQQIETQTSQVQTLQKRLDQAINDQASLRTNIDRLQRSLSDAESRCGGVTAELKAEKRAHQQSVALLNTALDDKNNTLQQLQTALLALAPDDSDDQKDE